MEATFLVPQDVYKVDETLEIVAPGRKQHFRRVDRRTYRRRERSRSPR